MKLSFYPFIKMTLINVFVHLLAITSFAQILSPQARELNYQLEAYVEVPLDETFETPKKAVEMQIRHLFGILASPVIVDQYKLDPFYVGGLGSPKNQMNIEILNIEDFQTSQKKMRRIYHRTSGQMIAHKKASEKFLKKGYIELPLPTNPYKIYRKKCTDPYYSGFEDFWYFYDPFRLGCEHLSKEPLAQNTKIKLQAVRPRNIQRASEIPLLRSDNGNGSLFSIYLIHGFAEDINDPNDFGRENFNTAHTFFIEQGFIPEKKKSFNKYPYYLYKKKVLLSSGREIDIEIQSLLVDTRIESKSKIFAKFFKNAIETADVILYEGHSGLGSHLDIPELEKKSGTFQFPNKKQLFFFNSCSSYSYYLDHFNAYKTKTQIDVITNGLAAYFHTSPLVLQELLKFLIGSDDRNFQWMTVLERMEKALDGETYLINVGGL